jgi:hypothetical protein
MPDPVETDCEKDFKRCKSKCFDVLVSNLALTEGDSTKEKDAREKYKKCRALCKRAKKICDETAD